jgi:hypothetical protein
MPGPRLDVVETYRCPFLGCELATEGAVVAVWVLPRTHEWPPIRRVAQKYASIRNRVRIHANRT